MNMQHILSSDYLDIVFGNRNKLYGAYELRKNYAKRLRYALLAVLMFCAVPFFILREDQSSSVIQPVHINATLSDIQVIPPPQPKPAEQTASRAQTKYNRPVVTEDNIPESEMLTQDELKDNIPGIATTEGDGADAPQPDEGTRKIFLPATGITQPVAVRYVAQMPEFNGDLNTYLFRNLKYPSFARENNIEGRVIVEFIINEDGSITEAKIIKGIGGGCDEEALRVIKNMPGWKAGMHNGKFVKVYFVLPIVFKLD